jgi:hypothetical protein
MYAMNSRIFPFIWIRRIGYPNIGVEGEKREQKQSDCPVIAVNSKTELNCTAKPNHLVGIINRADLKLRWFVEIGGGAGALSWSINRINVKPETVAMQTE